MTRRSAIAAILACAFGAAGAAAPTVESALTLADARRRAFERNWDLLAARSDVDLAEAQRTVAREYPNPSLSATVSEIPTDGTPASTPAGNGWWDRSYDTIVAVSQVVEVARKRSLRRASSDVGADASALRFADARRVLDAAVVKAYAAAALAEENGRLLRRTADFLRESARIASVRFEAGDISDSDRKQIEVEAERFEIEAKANDAASRGARVALDVLMGEREPRGDWQPADPLEGLVKAAAAADYREPGEPRPDIAAAEADLDRAGKDLSLEKAKRAPDPSLQLLYEHNPPFLRNALGVGVGIELPLWSRRKGEIAAASVARDRAALDRDRKVATAESERAASRAAFESARARWQGYESSILPKAEEVRASVAWAYRTGGASLLQLLEAERNANDLRLASAQAAADTLLSAADLAAALNVPLLPEHR